MIVDVRALNKQRCNKVQHISSRCARVNQFRTYYLWSEKHLLLFEQQIALSTAVSTWNINLYRIDKQDVYICGNKPRERDFTGSFR